ncbi:unnamed protein product [Danaus chrysippus]|uniref:(African queen) hypothetical protein n=1 Tax=Danaus chrysippus TaxID=151541 RepID=A0A8J2QYD7_9NEOP|nr:unnamed protein product [Danaus chrysippus]
MPRKSNVKKPGVRSYGTLSNYSSEKLEEALQLIKSGALTQRQVAKRYTIPRSTLNNKLRMKHSKAVGRPICLTMEEEIMFRDHLLALSDFGIPVGINDFKMLVKRYLTSINKLVPVFTDNTPGYEWGKLYLERHPALKEKIAHNISRKRAQVNEDMVNKFFDLLTLEADGVPPENIYNMDESGFHDDPGKKKLLFRRANRHPELIRNSTKSCFTVVFCGNAVGEFVPPFFIFKGKNCWSDWLQNAPKSSKMTVSKSGWIDADIFDECAHITVKALKLCEEHNIKFICLIPNSTHLLQPLDVGFFSSLKTAWRTVLRTWRLTQRGRKAISLPKNVFAQLLKLTLDQCESTAGLNLIAGFRKCGIHPVSRREVLQILPGYAATDVQTSVGETFKEYLKEVRESDLNIKSCRKFQLPVEAGKAVSAEEVETFYKNKIDEQTKKKEKPVKRGRPVGSKNVNGKKKKTIEQKNNTAADLSVPKNMNIGDRSHSDADIMSNVPETIASNDDMGKENYCNTINVLYIGLEDTRAANPESDTKERPFDDPTKEPEEAVAHLVGFENITGDFLVHSDGGKLVQINEQEEVFEVNKFCVFKDEGTLFPGQIRKISESSTLCVSCLTKNLNGGWIWPDKPDLTTITDLSMIIKVLRDNKISKRGKIIYIDDDFLSMEWGE